ncbi:DUF7343 domain-containing protein [Haloarchaeobius amylolyticus]|uniref:DUF7343 domain-containing protein n=1 Tax=Haloarchaeobius amylolyticus TaxID=1198296 RepID=UPI00227187AE|nr:helix-turn-helix domain-containing protein [Haloarchaeobius amylolyticus]
MNGRTIRCWLLVSLVLVGTAAVSPAQAAPSRANQTSIENVGISGPAVVDYNGSGDRVFLWQQANQTVTVQLTSPGGNVSDEPLSVCLRKTGSQSNTSSTGGSTTTGPCAQTTISGNTSTVTLSSKSWPFNGTGKQEVTVTVGNGSTVFDDTSVQVFVITKDGDVDGDSLSNTAELKHGTNLTAVDTDGDTLEDGPEVNEYGTDPTDPDTDGDKARDAREISVGTDPTNPDTDGDNLTDGFELENGLNATDADTDGDGLTDPAELDLGTNPKKADTDGDGLTDLQEFKWKSDPTVADTDGDGLDDAREKALGTDPTVADTDGDLLSDETEANLGTDPTSVVSPLLYVVLLVAILVAGRLVYTGRVDSASARAVASQYLGDEDDQPETGVETGQVEDRMAPPQESEQVGPEPPSTPVLTDEERVRQILRENGGRLQQKEIIEQTDWSKSKVSRLLSKMESEGEVRKISVGRENLITLPDEEPENSKPFF